MRRRPSSALSRRLFFPLAILALAVASIPAAAATIDINGYRFDPSREEPGVPASLRAPEEAGRRTCLVQFSGAVEEAWKESLRSLGASFHGYIPENAFIVRMDRAACEAARSLGFVRYLGPYHIAYRIHPGIGRMTFRNPERREDPFLTLRVCIAEDLATAALEASRIGTILETIDDPSQPGFVIRCDPARLQELAGLSRVLWVEERPETILMNNVTKWVVQSNVSDATPIWDQGILGEGQIVRQMDSGLDYNSCWFRDAGNAPPGPTHRKVIDYTTWGGSVYDGCDTGHGSHVAGTVCGDQSFINPGNYQLQRDGLQGEDHDAGRREPTTGTACNSGRSTSRPA